MEPHADRAELLRRLIVAHPAAGISAHASSGLPIPLPAALPLQPTHVRGRDVSVKAWLAEDRIPVMDAFDLARANGSSRVSARLASDPSAVCMLHMFDVRATYGAIVTVAVMQSGSLGEGKLEQLDRLTVPPRLARMTKSDTGLILSIDAATSTILGWTAEEMVGRRSLEFIHPDDHVLAVEAWFELLGTTSPTRRVRLRHRMRSAGWVWFEVSNTNLLQESEPCVLAEMVDVSSEMAAQELLARLTQALPVGVFQIDTGRRIIYTNGRLLGLLGRSDVGSVDDVLELATGAARAALEEAVTSVLQLGADRDVEVELLLRGADEPRHFQLNLRPLSKQHGDAHGAIGCLTDVTDGVLLRRALEHRATYDILTGCYNRQAIGAALRALLRPGGSAGGVGVCYVDLDRFKFVNDSLGHAAGDQLLALVGERLRGLAGEDGRVGRLGGDEFILVSPQLADAEAAFVLGRRVADALTGDVDLGPGRVAIGASVGIAWGGPGELDEEALVDRADAAMYVAKRRADGRPCLYSADLEAGRRQAPSLTAGFAARTPRSASPRTAARRQARPVAGDAAIAAIAATVHSASATAL